MVKDRSRFFLLFGGTGLLMDCFHRYLIRYEWAGLDQVIIGEEMYISREYYLIVRAYERIVIRESCKRKHK